MKEAIIIVLAASVLFLVYMPPDESGQRQFKAPWFNTCQK